MNRTVAVLLAVLLSALVFGSDAFALPGERAATLDNVMKVLNGKPVKAGTLETSGTAVNNATTGTPFTLRDGAAVLVTCSGGIAYVNVGNSSCTVSSTITNSAYGIPLDPNEKFYFILAPNESCIALVGASGVKCAVFELR